MNAAVCLETDPLNRMSIGHGMGCLADRDSERISVPEKNGNMLFRGTVRGICGKPFHGLTAADRIDTAVEDHADQVAANRAAVENQIIIHKVAFFHSLVDSFRKGGSVPPWGRIRGQGRGETDHSRSFEKEAAGLYQTGSGLHPVACRMLPGSREHSGSRLRDEHSEKGPVQKSYRSKFFRQNGSLCLKAPKIRGCGEWTKKTDCSANRNRNPKKQKYPV